MSDQSDSSEPFWKVKSLREMNQQEWESICDGCGRCCLHKLEDADTGELFYTNIACKLLDIENCRCSNYPQRFDLVSDCMSVEQDLYAILKWLPSTCGYRLLAEKKDLPMWHPLVSGDRDSVHVQGISVREIAISEEYVDDPQHYVIENF